MEPTLETESLVAFGGELKALGDGKVGGYLVRFTVPGDYDLTQERFAPDTDYGDRETVPVFYHHGLDATVGKRILAKANLRRDGFGVWAETQLSLRDEYEKFIYAQTEKGKMGWSSGVPSHLVEKLNEGKGYVIKMWHIAEASITPTPAEPRNTVVTLKSLAQNSAPHDPQANAKEDAGTASSSNAAVTQPIKLEGAQAPTEEKDMEQKDIQSMLDATTKLTQTVETLSADVITIKTKLAAEPAINGDKANGIAVLHDPADTPFANIAENCKAIKNYTISMGQDVAPRIKFLKATGASDAVPTDGGILLDPTLTNEFISPIHDVGVFSSKVRKLPVSSNSNSGWINGVDETSRVAGSRWGGVRGYRLAEAATLTASKPAFRRIQWELKKYGVLVYGTDELLQDSAQFSEVVNTACREELAFMVNDDIMNGIGLSGAQGFMNSGALITVTRTTGSKILGDDISALWNRMDPRGRARAEWYIGNDSLPQLDNLFAVGSTAVLYPYASIGADGVQRLYGRPINVTEFNATLNTTGDIVLADLSQYLFWEKSDVQAATSIHVQFTTDESVFRFVYRSDGKSSVASALTPYKGSTTTSPFVCLTSAT